MFQSQLDQHSIITVNLKGVHIGDASLLLIIDYSSAPDDQNTQVLSTKFHTTTPNTVFASFVKFSKPGFHGPYFSQHYYLPKFLQGQLSYIGNPQMLLYPKILNDFIILQLNI